MKVPPENPLNYRISVKEITDLMEYRGQEGIEKIQDHGGIEGLLGKLFSSAEKGLNEDSHDLDHRREIFGRNVIPPKPPKKFLRLIFEAVQDVTLIILIVAAIFSLGLSFYKPQNESEGKNYECIDK